MGVCRFGWGLKCVFVVPVLFTEFFVVVCGVQAKTCGLDDAGSSDAGGLSEVLPMRMSVGRSDLSLFVGVVRVLIRAIHPTQHTHPHLRWTW